MTFSSITTGRKSTRYDAALDVEISYDGQKYNGRTKNLSLGGMFIETAALLPFGARLGLRFSIPTLNETLEVNANIRWIDKKDSRTDPNGTVNPETLTGIGIQFQGLRAKHVWALNKFFEELGNSPQPESDYLERETASGKPG